MEIEELIKNDLGEINWNIYEKYFNRPIKFLNSEVPRVYFLGDLFGILLTAEDIGNSDVSFTIIYRPTADLPNSWIIYTGCETDNYFLKDLINILEIAKDWIKFNGKKHKKNGHIVYKFKK